MKLLDFLKDKCLLLLLHLVCMCLLAGFLRLTGYAGANTALVIVFWLLILAAWLFTAYLKRRKYFGEAEKILENIDQRYLLGELLPASFLLEDRLYQEMIRKSNKSSIERIRRADDEKRAYKEYIESWIHEIKAPISGISLLCGNRRGTYASGDISVPEKEAFKEISLENQRIENFVDMVLYFARSEEVYKDYLIQETSLFEAVCEVLDKNRLLMIQNNVRAEVDCPDTAYTDRKWIVFILNQIVLNSIKYRSASPLFHIYTKREKNSVLLTLEDNGIGIREEELSRIFEKGFTGSNGRNRERSTGMGLYLCRRLCGKLGIRILARSEYGKGTTMLLEFPVSSYLARCPRE